MDILTVDWLDTPPHRACRDQRDQFAAVFPDGIAITEENYLRLLAEGLDANWLIQFAPKDAQAEYERQRDMLWAEYERQRDMLWAEYERQVAPLWAEYKRQRDMLLAEYERQRAPLWAEYKRQRAPLWVACVQAIT